MKFQIGDLVVLKHTKTEGKIVGIENDEMFLVSVDGVDIPVFKENIDHPYFDWFTNDKNKKKNLKHITIDQLPKEKISEGSHWNQGIYLAFFPVFNDEEIEKFKVYLINQDKSPLKFKYKCSIQNNTMFTLASEVIPYVNFYIHDVSMEDMHNIPNFEIILEYYNALDEIVKSQVEIKIRPKKLFQFLQQLIQSDISFIQIFIDKNILKNINEPSVDIPVIVENKIQHSLQNNKRISEIDVHIDKLIPEYDHLSNAEIIQIQLSHFERVLHHAIQMNQDSLIVIHGVGKGVLKDEIHALLRMYKEVRHFICDWSPKYGYGATHIFFYT